MQFVKTVSAIFLLGCFSLNSNAQQPAGENGQQQIQTLAVVNGQQITRQQVANECMRRFGEEVLESVINKQLVYAECQAQGIVITEKDINDEIVDRARKFNMSDERYIKLITTRRNIPINRFKNDIIWSELALRKLAASELQVTQDEIQKRMDFEFGAKVQVREIVCKSRNDAEIVLQQVEAAPAEFGRYAKEYSINSNSASVSGLLPPIRQNSGLPAFEQIAFSLQPGQISPIFEIENRFIILKCERIFPATELAPEQVAEVNERIVDQLRNDKLAESSTILFKRLQETVKITNVINDPNLSQQMPGVAATVNDNQISKRFLAEECIARYGNEMLQTEINRALLLQALRSQNMQVSQEDINNEINRAAESYGYFGTNKTIDVDRWLKFVTKNDESKIDFYIEDEVWPSVALRKLVEKSVQVEQDDLKKGFEANYGPRVEALAIVLSDNRMALKVWDMAKNNLSKEYFGELAHQYSVEPLSRNNYGQVPPIQMHGGRPQLEQEAFVLNPGELSKIVQAGEHWIIMYCLGRTTPRVTDFEAVREELHKNIFEKKLNVAMSEEFERLRKESQIDNFLAGTSQAGRTQTSAKPNQNSAR
ncbi:MAG: peptidylprolyl isomerase [Planctomycetota bacterium]